jgi:carboxymethylenebutenolidase
MKQAGKDLTVKSYNAKHGFANPSNPAFDKPDADAANATAMEFIKGLLK